MKLETMRTTSGSKQKLSGDGGRYVQCQQCVCVSCTRALLVCRCTKQLPQYTATLKVRVIAEMQCVAVTSIKDKASLTS